MERHTNNEIPHLSKTQQDYALVSWDWISGRRYCECIRPHIGVKENWRMTDYKNEVKQLIRYIRKMNDGWTLTESELAHIESIKQMVKDQK